MPWIREYTKEDTRERIVYALIDPRTFQVRYVGQTVDLQKRLISHYYRAASVAMREWMLELRALKLKPQIIELERAVGFNVLKVEYKWLCIFRESGAPLVNHTGSHCMPDYRALTDWRWGDKWEDRPDLSDFVR